MTDEQLSQLGLRFFREGVGSSRQIPFSFNSIDFVRDVFIETGTDTGYTAIHARRSGFTRCHTIDINPQVVDRAKVLFSRIEGITAYLGDSRQILPQIIDPTAETTFWLDAHSFGGDDPYWKAEDTHCPLLEELAIILSKRWNILPLIMIDDAKDIINPLPDWPTFRQVTCLLHGYIVVVWCGGDNGCDSIMFCTPR